MFVEMEEKIKTLEGVISCRITGEEEINEIHIIAQRGRDPKRIVRDVETVILVEFNTEIDHKKISIAQVDRQEDAIQENRVELISIFRENNKQVCHFRMNINDLPVEEDFQGAPGETLSNIVARGILSIIIHHTSFPGQIWVENVFTTGMNNEIVIVQLVIHRVNGTEERLVGASYVNHDLPLATGKACLKAMNRRINT